MHGTHVRFSVWKTIQLGRFTSKFDLLNDLRSPSRGYFFHLDRATELALDHEALSVTTTRVEMNLAKVSCKDLGLEVYCGYSDICSRALELGLQLCPGEVGPELRLQCGDRSHSDIGPEENLTIAMRPTPVAEDREPVVFAVCGFYELETRSGHPKTVYRIEDQFVFVRP